MLLGWCFGLCLFCTSTSHCDEDEVHLSNHQYARETLLLLVAMVSTLYSSGHAFTLHFVNGTMLILANTPYPLISLASPLIIIIIRDMNSTRSLLFGN